MYIADYAEGEIPAEVEAARAFTKKLHVILVGLEIGMMLDWYVRPFFLAPARPPF